MANDDNNGNSAGSAAALWYFWRNFGSTPSSPPPPAPPPSSSRPFVMPPSANTTNQPSKGQPQVVPLSQAEIEKFEKARQERLRRKAAYYPARHLTKVGVGVFAAVLLTVNSNFIQLADKTSIINNAVKADLHPTITAMKDTKDISFAPNDSPYVVLSKKACVYEFMNRDSKSNVCFDERHKVRGAIVEPRVPTDQPEWLAIQPRDGNKIIGLAYMRLHDLEAASDPAPERTTVTPPAGPKIAPKTGLQ